MRTGANGTRGFNGLVEISAYGSWDAMSVSIFERLPVSAILERPRLYVGSVDIEAIQLITDGLLAEPDPLRQRLHTDFIRDTRPPIRMQFQHQPDECCLPVNIASEQPFKGTACAPRHGEGERSIVFIHRHEQRITPVMRELERPSNIPFRRSLPLNPARRFPKRVSDLSLIHI